MAERIIVKEVTCPVCKTHIFNKFRAEKKLYICANIIDKEEFFGKTFDIVCGKIQAYCKTCNKVYNESNFGLHNGAYECKECGTVNWAYTDYIKDKNNLKNKLR